MKMQSSMTAKTKQSGGGRQNTPALPQRNALLFPLCVIGCYWAILIYYIGAQWSVYEQYSYGWAVPFLCLYLLWGKAEMLKAEGAEEKVESGGGKAETLKSENPDQSEDTGYISFSAFQLFSFSLFCFLYAPTRFLHEANPTWRLTSLLWTLEVIGLTLLLLQMFTEVGSQRPQGRSQRSEIDRKST